MAKPLAPDGTKNLAGGRIRALRKARGLSQEELMRDLQLRGFDSERGVIKRMENGTRFVCDTELKILAEYFGVSYDFLIEGEKEK